MKADHWATDDIPSLTGRTIIITGANSGIGFEASRVLASKGASIIMASRNIEKGQMAANEVKKTVENADISVMQLDLADFESVRSFSKAFHGKYNRLDVLINNAGIMFPKQRELSKQGYESQFATNHLGHFLLTGLLMDLLKETPNSRVVTQSSILHKKSSMQNFDGDIYFNDINFEEHYDRAKAYAQSKLANLLFAYELDRKLKQNGLKMISAAAHPGYTATNLQRHSGFIAKIMNILLAQKVAIGALPIIRAATDEGVSGGDYYGPTKMNEIKGFPEKVRSNDRSYDTVLAKQLWELSEQITGFKYQF